MFDAFMSVFCVLTMEILECVIPCVTNEGGSGAQGSARRIFLWGGIWIGGLRSSGAERESLIGECAGESPL